MQFIVVEDQYQGIKKAKELLYQEVDKKTVLFLSGGKTPSGLYRMLVQEKQIHPAAVGMIDERFGNPMHEGSNEFMLEQTGLLGYLMQKGIPFYSMLSEAVDVAQAAKVYDGEVRDLFFKFPKSVGLLGMGPDAHIASIMPNRKDFTDPLFSKEEKYLYASHISDPNKYKERITLTFAGLSLLDKIILFVFGQEKKWALEQTFEKGSVEEIPARFFTQPDIAEKTIFISDQKL